MGNSRFLCTEKALPDIVPTSSNYVAPTHGRRMREAPTTFGGFFSCSSGQRLLNTWSSARYVLASLPPFTPFFLSLRAFWSWLILALCLVLLSRRRFAPACEGLLLVVSPWIPRRPRLDDGDGEPVWRQPGFIWLLGRPRALFNEHGAEMICLLNRDHLELCKKYFMQSKQFSQIGFKNILHLKWDSKIYLQLMWDLKRISSGGWDIL